MQWDQPVSFDSLKFLPLVGIVFIKTVLYSVRSPYLIEVALIFALLINTRFSESSIDAADLSVSWPILKRCRSHEAK